jgi:multiple sugar transport system substrate-binding protein
MNRTFPLFLTLIMAFVLVLSACSAPAAPATETGQTTPADTTGAAATTGDQIQLRIAWWGSQDRHDRTIRVIELYEEQNPDVDIVFEFSGWDDHWTKMTTQAAGNNLPDIMQHDYARLEEWVSRGLIMPLDQFVEDGTLDFSDIPESAIEGGRINGQLYGLNLGNNAMTMVADVDLFEQAGVPLPDSDWTWAEFEQIVMQLHEELDIYGIGGGLSNEQLWKALYLSLGGWVYNEDGSALGYEDDEPFIEYIEMVKRLQDAGAIPSRAQELADQGQSVEQQDIVTGEAAMGYMWSNQVVAVWNAAGEDRNFVLLPLPRPEGGAPSIYLKPSMFWSITSQARQPEEAARFLDFFTNNIEANEILLAERGVPISPEVRDSLSPLLGSAQQASFDYVAEVTEDASPIPPADVAGHADVISNVYWPLALDPFLYGQISAEQAVQALREEANDVLARTAR